MVRRIVGDNGSWLRALVEGGGWVDASESVVVGDRDVVVRVDLMRMGDDYRWRH
jgi:hypothetical protein